MLKSRGVGLAICLVSLAFLSPRHCIAQVGQAIEFQYDGIGNRVLRFHNPSAILNKYGDTVRHDSPADTIKKATLSERDILVKAYPNPVADELIVENLSWNDKDNSTATVKIFDVAGKAILSRSFRQHKDQFSLASLVPGTYTVLYYINDRLISNWKIIKK